MKKGTTVSVEKVFDDDKTLFFDYEVDINGKMASSFSFLDADKHDRLAIVKDGEETAFSKLEAGDIVTFYTAKDCLLYTSRRIVFTMKMNKNIFSFCMI